MSKDNKADPKVSIPLSRYNALMDAERQLEIFINDRPKVLWDVKLVSRENNPLPRTGLAYRFITYVKPEKLPNVIKELKDTYESDLEELLKTTKERETELNNIIKNLKSRSLFDRIFNL